MPTPVDEITRLLRKELGQGWSLGLHHVNSSDFGLPQSRGRMYIVGRRTRLYPNGTPCGLPVFAKRTPASE
eukprot:5494200-Alexandrium_andersonii.AAC.1